MNPLRQRHRRLDLRLKPLKDDSGRLRKVTYRMLKPVHGSKPVMPAKRSRVAVKRERARQRARDLAIGMPEVAEAAA